MSDELIDTLRNLKEKLNSLESNYDNKLSSLDKRTKIHNNLEKKLDNLVTLQGERVEVEAGGRLYETSKSTIKNCIFGNILKTLMEKEDSKRNTKNDKVYESVYYINNQPTTKQYEIKYFVDIDKKSFKIILNLLRFIANMDNETSKFLIFLNNEIDESLLRKELKYFFNNEDIIFEVIEFSGENYNF